MNPSTLQVVRLAKLVEQGKKMGEQVIVAFVAVCSNGASTSFTNAPAALPMVTDLKALMTKTLVGGERKEPITSKAGELA